MGAGSALLGHEQGDGWQFSDVDLLIAALTVRLNATLVSADADFDALPIRREDWR